MSARQERHARAKSDWGTQPARSTEIRAAAAADPDPSRRAPARKDRRSACKANHYGPHVLEIVYVAPPFRPRSACEWQYRWIGQAVAWRCCHEEHCAGCGKVFRITLEASECPDYPGSPEQRAQADREAAEAVQRVAERRAAGRRVITGPQGYRRRREST